MLFQTKKNGLHSPDAVQAEPPSGTYQRPTRLALWSSPGVTKTTSSVLSNEELSELRPATVLEAMQMWEPAILRISVRGVSDNDLPDLIQEIFLALHKAWESQIIPSDCPFAYAIRIAVNCRSRLLKSNARQERRKRFLEAIGFLRPDRLSHESQEETATSARQQLRLVLGKGLASLPKRQREAFVLVCLDDFSFKDTAVILGVHTNTVRERVKAARVQLERFLRN